MAEKARRVFPRVLNADSLKAISDIPLYDVVDYKESSYSTVNVSAMNGENIYAEATATSNANGRKNDEVRSKKILIYLLAVLVSTIILILICGCFVAVFLQIADLKSQPLGDEGLSNFTDRLEKLEKLESSQVQHLNATLSSIIEDRSGEIEGTQLLIMSTINGSLTGLEDRLNIFEDFQKRKIQQLNMSIADINQVLGAIFAGVHAFYPATSCAALPPSFPSGYYWVRASNGSAVHVYCDMTRSCGGVTGGWRRVAELDMTHSSHQCPSGLGQRTDSNKRTCVRNSDSAGCSSVTISTATMGYSRVCGKITAYQVATPDAFYVYVRPGPSLTIDSPYVDGVSLTHGNPRQHIWTFAAALDEVGRRHQNCPCINTNFSSAATQPPAFVRSDYFCDTGSSERFQLDVFYGDNPLWDGAGCGPLNTCCSFNNPPWFSKQLPQPTTDDIEMRVCRDQDASDEDIAIETVEIYVQ